MNTKLTAQEALKLFHLWEDLIIAGVPASRAIIYFGKEALEHAENVGKLEACNSYGIGKRCSMYKYFTLKGIELAATYRNINLLLDEEEATK